MGIEKALIGYETALRRGNLHVYAVNSCYDRCPHCYIDAVTENSPKSRFIDAGNLFHFVDLLKQDKPTGLQIGLSGGDPLLHPEIIKILDTLSHHSKLEILTSGYALSSRNNYNRKELLESLVRNKLSLIVASPEEPYHSINWKDISEIRHYIKEQGFSPNQLGYPSRTGNIVQKILVASTIIGGVAMAISYLLERISNNKMPQVIPIGRAAKLPKEQQQIGTRNCTTFEDTNEIFVNYNGNLQYCMYACHDGFMNIEELIYVKNKKDAIKLIITRLSQDDTFKDMAQHQRCYFSKKIRKK